MRRLIMASLLVALVLCPIFEYVYLKGCQDGVTRYKHSKSFSLTLYSMYLFGLHDGYDACKGKK